MAEFPTLHRPVLRRGRLITKAVAPNKLGIRASDTATIVLEDCRVPLDNLLGSAEVQQKSTDGFKGVMATFDATRPAVAASALGIGQASIDFVRISLYPWRRRR